MDSILLLDILPILVSGSLALLIPTLFLILSSLLGPRSPEKEKLATYECGIASPQQAGDARHRFAVKFYQTAVFFLIFDVEILFLYPWAIYFVQHPIHALFLLSGFLGVLFLGWLYLVKRGALQWE